MPKSSCRAPAALLAVFAAASPAAALDIVVPNAFADVEGNTNSTYPLNIGDFPDPVASTRYQEVFAASEFAALGGPQLITRIAFRPDVSGGGGGPYSGIIQDLQINFSTTAKEPATTIFEPGLSAVLAENVGADDQVAFRGPVVIASAFTGPATGPKDFDIVIDLDAPFLYDPSLGNLLLEVRNYTGDAFGVHRALDAAYGTGKVFSAFTVPNHPPGGVNGTFGTRVASGLVTRFTFGPSSCPSIALTPALPGATSGVPYSASIVPNAGTPPFSFTAIGQPPAGLALSSGGVLSGVPTTPGSYSFVVAAQDAAGCRSHRAYTVEVVPFPVAIDVKPGSYPNSVNLGSNGKVAVAIFSTPAFDATTLVPETVTLANAAVDLRGNGSPMATAQDVNSDGLADLVVHVRTQALGLTETDTQATLSGTTSEGFVVAGSDTVRVVN